MDKRKFTLRLSEEEYRELSKIKELIGTGTNTQAIRSVISHFVELNKRYTEAINKNVVLKEEYRTQDRCLDNFLKSLEKLKELEGLRVVIPGRKNNNE